MSSGARSPLERGSSRRSVSGASRRSVVVRGRSGTPHRRHERRRKTCAPPLQVSESRKCLGVAPLEVVDEQHDRAMLGDERDERLEHLDLLELRPG